MEEVLLADPRVGAAVVVGLPDPVLGAVPVAYVVAPGLSVPEQAELVAHLQGRCRAELNAFKVPVTTQVVDNLPVGPTGKVPADEPWPNWPLWHSRDGANGNDGASYRPRQLPAHPRTGRRGAPPPEAPSCGLHAPVQTRPCNNHPQSSAFRPGRRRDGRGCPPGHPSGPFRLHVYIGGDARVRLPSSRAANFGRFWRRRLLAVAVPYALWTLFYFFWESVPGVSAMYRPTGGITRSALSSLDHFGYLLLSGYYQLYFLVLLLEFYLVYPLFLWLLRLAGRPWLLLATSAAAQLGITCLLHWGLTPGWLNGFWGAREIWDYQLYLVAGGLMALYYREVHAWLCRHWRLVLLATVVTLVSAEAWYWLADLRIAPRLGGINLADPFQPVVIPLFVCLIAAIYLLGVVVAHPRAPAWIRSAAQSGADNSFGIYLSQVLFLSIISMLGWGKLATSLSWPVVVLGAVVVVFVCSAALTAVLARLPGAKATSGRPRQQWRRLEASGPPQLVAGAAAAVSPGWLGPRFGDLQVLGLPPVRQALLLKSVTPLATSPSAT